METNFIDTGLALSSPFSAPDTLAVQTFNQVYTSKQASPEKRLLVALLEDAIFCLSFQNSRNCKKQKLYGEAREWIADTGDDPFSFVFICDELGLPTDPVRLKLLQRGNLTNRKQSFQGRHATTTDVRRRRQRSPSVVPTSF